MDIKELKELVLESGIPQTVLADRIGYAAVTINRVLNAGQLPGPDLLIKLSELREYLLKVKKAGATEPA